MKLKTSKIFTKQSRKKKLETKEEGSKWKI